MACDCRLIKVCRDDFRAFVGGTSREKEKGEEKKWDFFHFDGKMGVTGLV
jgi:hypothetical protein